MHKVKLNPGLASIILVATLFAGWQTMLLVALLMFIFCDVEEHVKNVAATVLTFFVGLTIVTVGWDLLRSALNVLVEAINVVLNLGLEFDILSTRGVVDINEFIENVMSIVRVVDNVVGVLFTFAKLGFAVAILTGKAAKQNVVTKKINEYVNSAINYVNNMGVTPTPAPAPAPQPAQPTNVQQ